MNRPLAKVLFINLLDGSSAHPTRKNNSCGMGRRARPSYFCKRSNILVLNLDRIHLSDDQLYHVRSIDHNIPAGRFFEMGYYWQILLVNPPLPDEG